MAQIEYFIIENYSSTHRIPHIQKKAHIEHTIISKMTHRTLYSLKTAQSALFLEIAHLKHPTIR